MSEANSRSRSTAVVAGDPTVGGTSERLNELAMSFKKSQALSAALEVDLFSALARGAGTPDEVAVQCGIDREAADRLMIICKAMGLVAEVNGRCVNYDDVERFLVRDNPTFFGDFLRFTIGAEYDEWRGFANNFKHVSSAPPPSKLYEGDLSDPARARDFTTAGYNSSIALAHRLAKRFDFSRFSKWLDFAGGSGCYAIAACKRHAGIRVVVKDHPNVVPVTREFIAKHELETRIEAEPGDFLKREDFPERLRFNFVYHAASLVFGGRRNEYSWLCFRRTAQWWFGADCWLYARRGSRGSNRPSVLPFASASRGAFYWPRTEWP